MMGFEFFPLNVTFHWSLIKVIFNMRSYSACTNLAGYQGMTVHTPMLRILIIIKKVLIFKQEKS
jgi:hypothetical protein